MTYQYDGYNWIVRIQKGELLVEQLTNLVREQKIGGAWISGLGATQDVELGFYNLDSKSYSWKRFHQLMEITSLQGNIAWDGENPVIHLHGTFSDHNMQAFGGHVRELQAGGTVELLLHKWYSGSLAREKDTDTGLKLLSLH